MEGEVGGGAEGETEGGGGEGVVGEVYAVWGVDCLASASSLRTRHERSRPG